MKRLSAKLTYANVISTLCLVLLVGGGTAYAATEMLPNGSVGSKQIKKEAVTPAKLSKAAKSTLTGPAGATGATGPQGKEGAQGKEGPRGLAGEEGEPGSALGFARIKETGAIDTTQSENIGALTVAHPATGVYCLSGLPFAPENVMATTQFITTSINAFVGAFGGCPAGTQVSVEENFTSTGQAARDAPFMLLFN